MAQHLEENLQTQNNYKTNSKEDNIDMKSWDDEDNMSTFKLRLSKKARLAHHLEYILQTQSNPCSKKKLRKEDNRDIKVGMAQHQEENLSPLRTLNP